MHQRSVKLVSNGTTGLSQLLIGDVDMSREIGTWTAQILVLKTSAKAPS